MEVLKVVCELVIPTLIFGVLFAVGKFIYQKMSNSESRVLNPSEYFPQQELETLRQVFYLIMMMIFFVFILYIMMVQAKEILPIAVLQVILSIYVALTLDYSKWYNKILFFLLVPYESLVMIVSGDYLSLGPI